MQYSPDQQLALDRITTWLADSDQSVCALTGSAGTGKTALMKAVIEHYTATTDKVPLCTALTHKAATVLAREADMEVLTLHKAFGITPSRATDGSDSFRVNPAYSVLEYECFIIVDEASMLGHKLLAVVAAQVKLHKAKILFVGDPYQLPPINDYCSIFDGSLPTYELTTVHRQVGNTPLLDKAIEYRDFLTGIGEYPHISMSILNEDNCGIHLLTKEQFNSELNAARNWADTPVCTYTNERAIDYNKLLRKQVYVGAEPFYIGEVLVSNSIVMSIDNTVQLQNNEECTVIGYITGSLADIPGYYVTVQRSMGQSAVQVFVPECIRTTKTALRKLKAQVQAFQHEITRQRQQGLPVHPSDEAERARLWRDYYAFTSLIADLRPPYAGTVHKMQGSTYSNVYIDMADINRCPGYKQKARLLYVALTRARYSAFIVR